MAEPTASQCALPVDLAQTLVSFAVRRDWEVNELLSAAEVSPMLLAEGRSRLTDE